MNLEKMMAVTAQKSRYEPAPIPPAMAAVAEQNIVDLDVRDDLRNGVEPFNRIMQAQQRVAPGAILRVRAIFDPVPLYMVLGKQGFSHWTEKLADDDWRVWFYRGDATAAPATTPSVPPRETINPNQDLIIIDVRNLEPPEPMAQTLFALETLPPGKALLQVNARVPQFLLPILEERGFEYVLVDEQPGEVRGLIRRKTLNHTDTMKNTTEKELDVRIIPPREKHPAIFATFDALDAGDAFILINDHDPFPLRHQFDAERSGRFSWDYVEQGPVVWRVRIAKVA